MKIVSGGDFLDCPIGSVNIGNFVICSGKILAFIQPILRET